MKKPSSTSGIEVRVDYAASAGEVYRVFMALSAALAGEGRVWLDAQLHQVDDATEGMIGTAVIEVFVTSRAWAHRSIRRALADIDPERDVIMGGDLQLAEIGGPVDGVEKAHRPEFPTAPGRERQAAAMVDIEGDEFAAELTWAVVEDCRVLLSRRNDVAIAYLAHLQYRTFPPDLLVLTHEQVDEILADEDRDIHDIAPAEWGHAQIFLPHGEGHDQWNLAEQVRDTGHEAVALAAVHQAAGQLAAEFQDIVVLAFDYEAEDEQLANALDRILPTGVPLRALL